jgi:hypothetical protein
VLRNWTHGGRSLHGRSTKRRILQRSTSMDGTTRRYWRRFFKILRVSGSRIAKGNSPWIQTILNSPSCWQLNKSMTDYAITQSSTLMLACYGAVYVNISSMRCSESCRHCRRCVNSRSVEDPKTEANHIADLRVQTDRIGVVGGERCEIGHMAGDSCMGTAQKGGC